MSKFPVIIAACNEEQMIDRALGGLPANLYEPIVAVNGSEDNTARVAKEYGATVIELVDQGKLPAIQEAVKTLGAEALKPILFLDADSKPVFPRKWGGLLLAELAPEKPSAATAGFVFTDGNCIVDAIRSYRRRQLLKNDKKQSASYISGANMALNFANKQTLSRFMDMPHIWPGEDHAIGRLITLQDGGVKHILDPLATVLTSSRYFVSFRDRLLIGAEAAGKKNREHYLSRRSPGSRPFRPKSELGY